MTPMASIGGGPGHAARFICMGCNTPRDPLGSRGVGALKRCSFCLERRAARARMPAGKLGHFLELTLAAGPEGLSSAHLSRVLCCSVDGVAKLRHEAAALGFELPTCRSGKGKGGGALLHFASQADRDAYAARIVAEKQARGRMPKGLNAGQKPSTDGIVSQAMSAATPLEMMFNRAARAAKE